jgi:hypothetical protein
MGWVCVVGVSCGCVLVVKKTLTQVLSQNIAKALHFCDERNLGPTRIFRNDRIPQAQRSLTAMKLIKYDEFNEKQSRIKHIIIRTT